MQPSKEQQARGEKLYKFFDGCDDGYYESGRHHFEVNVKRHNERFDVEKAIEKAIEEGNIKKQFKKECKKRLTERMSGEHVDSIYRSWLEWECECLHGVFTSKGSQSFDEGEPELRHFEHVIPYGFAGRQGGHYLFDMYVSLDDLTDIAERYEHRFSDSESIDEALDLYERMKEDALWLKDYVKKYNDGLDFQDELEFRTDEELTSIMSEIQSEIDHKNKVDKANRIADKLPDEGERALLKSFIK